MKKPKTFTSAERRRAYLAIMTARNVRKHGFNAHTQRYVVNKMIDTVYDALHACELMPF